MVTYTQSPLLASLRGRIPPTPPAVQRQVIDALIGGLESFYCHLPQKRSAFGFDPIARLRILGQDQDEGRIFDRRVLQIITDLRDRHTTIRLPQPWANLVAYVPFLVEKVSSETYPRFVVTKQLFGYTDVPIGATLTHWNGTPLYLTIANLANETQGTTRDARERLALSDLTLRPLAYMPMPSEDWVQLRYVTRDGKVGTTATPWRFYVQQYQQAAASSSVGSGASQLGLDEHTSMVNQIRKEAKGPETRKKAPLTDEGPIRYGTVDTPSGPCAYLRIFSFEVPDAVQFVTRIAQILAGLPQERLIIDVRGNPGGLIPSGQMLVRLLTKKPISPATLTFRATDATQKLSAYPEFQQWNSSLGLRFRTAESYSQAYPIQAFYDGVPDYRYPGKTVLVIDALCYSTTDFFSADFSDNAVGPIVGTDHTTGGGGANVWTWSTLVQYGAATGLNVQPLPGGFDLNISMRRALRTGPYAGLPIEDLGVRADVVHRLTERDLLEDNADLLATAAAQIA
jgi:hypothetical protein